MSRGTSIRDPKTSFGGGGRGPTERWPGGWEGGGGRGGGDNQPNYSERLRRYRMIIIMLMSSVVMLFVSFTTVYVVRKAGETWDPASNNYASHWVALTLPVHVMLLNTAILLLSSVTLEAARRRVMHDVVLAPIADIPGIRVSENHALPWLWATILLGGGFLAGQVYAWRLLEQMNPTFATNTSISLFFIVTGVHAVHLLGGLIALLYAGISNLFHRPPETRRIILDVTAWYWHFMGALWIYIFGLLYFAR